MNINSYPKVYQIGHRAISDILLDDVIIEEKIDGSQFSFGVIDGELKARSKGKEIYIDEPEKMFSKAIDTIKKLKDKLSPGWFYRGEYLRKPKHNTLCYNRIPENNIIIFDINMSGETYLYPKTKRLHCQHIGLECVPLLYSGEVDDINTLTELLERKSILGGETIEGFVIKNYNRFGEDKKVLMGKYVTEKFKERHDNAWKKANPKNKDILSALILSYKTEARWDKSIQHLRDNGDLENTPRDIGKLIKEIKDDVSRECSDEIKEILYKHAIPNILRGVVGGFPEYYKKKLLEGSL